MANIQLQYFTGSAWSDIFPQTLGSLVKINGTALEANNKVNPALIANITPNGTDTLLDSNKIRDTYLPNYIFGGMKFVSVNTPDNLYVSLADLYTEISSYANKNGYYWIINKNVSVTVPTGYTYTGEGTLESGDWLVCQSSDGKTWSSVNNTYDNATNSSFGIVRLSDKQTYSNLEDSVFVVTEDVLKDIAANDVVAVTKDASETAGDTLVFTKNSGSTSITIGNAAHANTATTAMDYASSGGIATALSGKMNVSGGTFTGRIYGSGSTTFDNADQDEFLTKDLICGYVNPISVNVTSLLARTNLFYGSTTPTGAKSNDIWVKVI